MNHDLVQILFVGPLHQDYVIGPHNDVYFEQPGGCAMYAAVGARVWTQDTLALASRVGEDFPQSWLQQLESHGIDCSAVRVISGARSTRAFYEYRSDGQVNEREPRVACTRHGVPLPKDLLDYTPPGEAEGVLDHYVPLALRPEDLPAGHRHARAAYLAPAHIATHTTLPALLRASGMTTIALSPSPRYLSPTSLHQTAPLLSGINMLLVEESLARSLYREFSRNLAEIAGRLAALGWPLVIVHRDDGGQVVFQTEPSRAAIIPPYPAEIRNPVGALGAFAGGYLAGWHLTFDPVEAAQYGNISASLSVEGPGACFALTRMKGLAEARLGWLKREMTRA
jgi:sugar/nucleoside kinase (ribokinase family)